MENQTNYLIQSNFFNETVLGDISEIQKDIIYYLQSIINFQDSNPTGSVEFDYKNFIKFKKTERNLTYSPKEIHNFCKELISLNGVIYNKKTQQIEFFNIIDRVSVSEMNSENFIVSFASWGKIFFYEKYAVEYAESSKISYTQIEKNIIDLKGDKRKKLFELLSQYKETGLYRVSLVKLKTLLGFIIFDYQENEDTPSKQLTLFEPDRKPIKEFFKTWYEFRRSFLEPAIEEINRNTQLDVCNITYTTAKKGTKIEGLEFRFKKRIKTDNLSKDENNALKYFSGYGLTETQILFLLQRIGYQEMFRRVNEAITFNNQYDNKQSSLYRRKVWFDNSNGAEIKKLGGFLYDKVFPELKKC